RNGRGIGRRGSGRCLRGVRSRRGRRLGRRGLARRDRPGRAAGPGGPAGAGSALPAERAAPTSAVGLVSAVVGCSAVGSDGGVSGEDSGTGVSDSLTIELLRKDPLQGGTLPPGSAVGQVGGAPSGAHRLRELYSDTRVRDDASRRRAPHRAVGDNGGGTQPR